MSENEVGFTVGLTLLVVGLVAWLWVRRLAYRVHGPSEGWSSSVRSTATVAEVLALVLAGMGAFVVLVSFALLTLQGPWSLWLWVVPAAAVAVAVQRVNTWATRRQRAREGDL